MKAIKRIVIVLLLSFAGLTTNASINVKCDVIYKNEDGEWSDFLRTRVTFCLGHEINEYLESRTVFAIIWPPDSQRLVLKMKDSRPQTQELDLFNTFLLLSTNDMLNQGIDFELYNAGIKQEWKIYPKDEIGLLIDENLSSSQSGVIYNDGTLRNRQNGFNIDRQRPKDDPKYLGELGEIIYKDQWLFYIAKVNDKFIAMERKDFLNTKIEVGEQIVGDYTVNDEKREFYNKTRDIDGYLFIVLRAFNKNEDCEGYIRSLWPF